MQASNCAVQTFLDTLVTAFEFLVNEPPPIRVSLMTDDDEAIWKKTQLVFDFLHERTREGME